MTYMQWTQELETGIPVIDNQHKRIVEYINELHDASQTDNVDQIKQVLDKLIDYTITHFEFEEALLERSHYPFLNAHKKVHDMFKRRIEAFLERTQNGDYVIPELMGMLKVWLFNHIKGDDSDYVDSVQAVTAGGSQESTGWITSSLQRIFGGKEPLSDSST